MHSPKRVCFILITILGQYTTNICFDKYWSNVSTQKFLRIEVSSSYSNVTMPNDEVENFSSEFRCCRNKNMAQNTRARELSFGICFIPKEIHCMKNCSSKYELYITAALCIIGRWQVAGVVCMWYCWRVKVKEIAAVFLHTTNMGSCDSY